MRNRLTAEHLGAIALILIVLILITVGYIGARVLVWASGRALDAQLEKNDLDSAFVARQQN